MWKRLLSDNVKDLNGYIGVASSFYFPNNYYRSLSIDDLIDTLKKQERAQYFVYIKDDKYLADMALIYKPDKENPLTGEKGMWRIVELCPAEDTFPTVDEAVKFCLKSVRKFLDENHARYFYSITKKQFIKDLPNQFFKKVWELSWEAIKKEENEDKTHWIIHYDRIPDKRIQDI